MIYKVTIRAPAINEEITTSARDPEQARADAVYSAYQRALAAAEVTVEEQGDA